MCARLKIDDADAAVAAARAAAGRLGVDVSIAVVDDGGNLKAFARMDGAELGGPTLAVDKAYTAVAHRIDTAALGPLSQPGGELQGLHANGAGRYVTFGGGIPIRRDGQVIGAIGVSGAAVTEDVECATAAVQQLAARWAEDSDDQTRGG